LLAFTIGALTSATFFQLLANCQKSKSNKDDSKALPSMPIQRGRAFVACEIGTDFYFPLFDAKY